MPNLDFRVDKPDNTYRYIEEWEAVPSTHGNNIHYLFLYGIFKWQGRFVRSFAIVVQYGSVLGQNVELQLPPHILAEDAERVWAAFAAFRERCSAATTGLQRQPGPV